MGDSFFAANALKSVLLGILLSKLIIWIRQIVKFCYRKRSETPFPNVPFCDPSPHWYMGSVKYMATMSGHEILTSKFADPETGISTFWGPTIPVLSVLKADHAREIFRYSAHRNHVHSITKHYQALLGKNALITTSGKIWKENRKFILPAFSNEALNDAGFHLRMIVNRSVQNIHEAIKNSSNENDTAPCIVMDVMKFARNLALDVFGTCCLGYDFGCTLCTNGKMNGSWVGETFTFLIKELNLRCSKELMNPFSQNYWIPTRRNLKYKKEKQKIINLLLEVIQSATDESKSARGNAKKQKILIERVVSSPRPPSSLSTDECLSEFLITLLFGGYDTTSICITYALYNLAIHPEIQEKCCMEAKKQLEHTFDDPVKHLPYSWAVIMESLRIYPPVPFTARSLGRKLEVPELNVTFERETRVFMSFWNIHRYEKNFARASEFIPERWVSQDQDKNWIDRSLEGNESTEEKGKSDYCPPGNKSHMLGFSAGARTCIGQKFAMREAITVVSNLTRDFKFELVEGYKLQPVKTGLVQSPKDGMPLIIRKR